MPVQFGNFLESYFWEAQLHQFIEFVSNLVKQLCLFIGRYHAKIKVRMINQVIALFLLKGVPQFAFVEQLSKWLLWYT